LIGSDCHVACNFRPGTADTLIRLHVCYIVFKPSLTLFQFTVTFKVAYMCVKVYMTMIEFGQTVRVAM